MGRKLSREERLEALRDSLVLLSLVIPGGVAVLVMLLGYHSYISIFSLDPDAKISGGHLVGFLSSIFASLIVGFYAGVLLWLICARYVFRFSRSDIERLALYGPLTRFDKWLISLIYRHNA